MLRYGKSPNKLRAYRIYVEGNGYIIVLLPQDKHFHERIYFFFFFGTDFLKDTTGICYFKKM